MASDAVTADRWHLGYERYEPEAQGRRETLCALGNGRFVTRGAAAWASADGTNYPGTYLAGGYDRAVSDVAGHQIENEDLANLPNWLPITFRVGNGAWFHLDECDVVDFRQELDMRRGTLEITADCRAASGPAFRICELRLVHMSHPALAAQRVTIEFDEPVDDEIEVRAGIDGNVTNEGVERYADLVGDHVDVVETDGGDDRIWLRARTRSSGLDLVFAADVTVSGLDSGDDGSSIRADGARIDAYRCGHLANGSSIQIDKVLAVHASGDRPGYEPLVDACRSLDVAGGFDELLHSHTVAWESLWRRSHLDLAAGDDWADMALRLHLFHMHQTFSRPSIDLDVGIPARGWHGEAYRGHIFWDELFVLPFFAFRFPERSRAAIRYRHRRLEAARRAARQAGYRGAMYPWQSGSTGREESQRQHLNPRSGRWNPDPTHRQRHIGIAIAYNVWRHWQVTADHEFLHGEGADILLSIADYFADLATWDPERERYVITGVIGPDEYHTAYPGADEPGLDNNAYTNIMASWVLARALEVHGQLSEFRCREIESAFGIDEERLAEWDRVSRRLFVPFLEHPIIEQFEGYRDLAEFDWAGYRDRYDDISRLDRILEAEEDSPNNYKTSKQPDVVMLFYLLTADELTDTFDCLGYDFDADDIPPNVDYYLARTSHGSTLSKVVHSWVAARSDRTRSWELYRAALASDIEDVQGGTTPEGIHLGAMAGSVDLAQRCYSGLAIDGDTIRMNPRLPAEVEHLDFRFEFRTHWIVDVSIDHDTVVISCDSSRPEAIRVAIKDEHVTLESGDEHRFDLERVKPSDDDDVRTRHRPPGQPQPPER